MGKGFPGLPTTLSSQEDPRIAWLDSNCWIYLITEPLSEKCLDTRDWLSLYDDAFSPRTILESVVFYQLLLEEDLFLLGGIGGGVHWHYLFARSTARGKGHTSTFQTIVHSY